ncbi:hypothetical protein [Limisalsivibrio acetivorans]|uniref:hypothetical protein n=1 Tax=Limisalsivibrio acetivorans TaxID=1304888 RepID=UPI0003B49FCB|nr:hypothetical protein [Limisalsivibrio acetivorans]
MNFLHKEFALFLASGAFMASFVYKVFLLEVKLTYVARDFIMFFVIYFVAEKLFLLIDKIIINYRKIL